MNRFISIFIHLAVALFIFFSFQDDAYAFHEGIACSRCHKLFPKEGKENKHTSAPASDTGLAGSELCLSCHDSNQDSSNLNPPYVLNENTVLAGGSFTPTLFLDQVGHNILSRDIALGWNPPGGRSMDEFGCLSCHDPHNNGNYRNLKTEINGRPTLVQAMGDPNCRDNIYLSGMDDFCASCHEQFHGGASTRGQKSWVRHPTGMTMYGAQNADFAGWSQRKPGLTLVENPTGNPNDRYSAKVFCLSCHYAHAGPYDNAVRWDNARSNKGCLECHSLDDD